LCIHQVGKSEQNIFMQGVEYVMNEEIFGICGCQSNWKTPVNDGGSLGAIKFANFNATH
jgi:hypothetical protein